MFDFVLFFSNNCSSSYKLKFKVFNTFKNNLFFVTRGADLGLDL